MSQLTRIAAALAAVMAAPAFAATAVPVSSGTLYGGGATLPVSAYVGGKWLGFNPAHRLNVTSTSAKVFDANPADPVSLFGNFTVNGIDGLKTTRYKVSYCATGSGTGRNIIRGTVNATGACGDYSGTPAGFSAATAEADFAGTDAPFSASEYTSFTTGPRVAASPSRVAPVQFPAVAGAIGVVYNNADLANTALNLTESQICQIFSGQITNWNQINASLPSKNIVLVPRSDSSGTTFSFTNHLSAVCPTAYPVAVTGLSTQSKFVDAVGGTLPAGSSAQDGNGGVVNKVLTTDGAIGYAEIADGRIRAALAGGQLLRYATVSIKPDVAAYQEKVPVYLADGVTPKIKNGVAVEKIIKHKAVIYKKMDPLKNLPASLAITAQSDKVLGPNDANGRPTIVSLTPAGGATLGCMQLVDPAAYAKAPLNAKTGDYTQYPIVAVSYLTGYNYGNSDGTAAGDAKAAALRSLFKLPYGISSKVKTIGKKTGFAGLTLTLDANAAAANGTALVDACVKN